MSREKGQITDKRSMAGDDSAAAVAGLFGAAVRNHQAGVLDEAERGYREVLALAPNHADSLHYLGVIAHQRGRNDVAADLIGKAIAANGRDSQSHYHFGIVSDALGRSEEAIAHYRQAIVLFPDHVNAHLNIAAALVIKRQWDEAGAHCRRALELAPNHPGALNSLGLAFQGMGKFDQAAACFQAALQAKPDLIEALRNHATLRLDAGRPDEAMPLLVRALGTRDDVDTKRLLVACLTCGTPLPATDTVRDLVFRAFSECWAWPDELARIAGSFIKTGPAKEWLRRTNDALGVAGLEAMAGDKLLLIYLETTCVSDIELERLFAGCRAAMLELAGGADAGDLERHEVLAFCCALARQCFINEYVWSFGEQEIERARRLRDAVAASLKDGKPVPGAALAAVAAYFPLYSIEGVDALPGKSWPAPVAALLTQQIREPQAERELRASIPQLTPIEGEVSHAVQQQYEDNPYPRWIRHPQQARPRTVSRLLREVFPLSDFVGLDSENSVESLIAGCGTGRQPIEQAQTIAGAKFLAIDLSMASLSYAKRKTREFGIAAIDYAQADILKLKSAGRTFNVIECCGVLHHLAEPLEGWRVLLSILEPGGFMRIALYSEIARRDVVAAQRFVQAGGYPPTADGIRRCRQDILQLASDDPVRRTLNMHDFYNTSGLRDLLFHAMEHRMTIPGIGRFIADNGLIFLGFDVGRTVRKRFADKFPHSKTQTELDLWHEFEQENPDTFINMYNFWLQKPRRAPISAAAHG